MEITFRQFLWRFFTGHFMDGKEHKKETWWSKKHRANRALHRWAAVIIPIGWVIAYKTAPTIQLNLTIALTGMVFPFVLYRVTMIVVKHIPKTQVVHVFHEIGTQDDTIPDDALHFAGNGDEFTGDESPLTEMHIPADSVGHENRAAGYRSERRRH